MGDTLENKLDIIYKTLEQEAAVDIVVLDMQSKCSWTDYLVIATASSRIHLNHITRTVRHCMLDIEMTAGSRGKERQEESWTMLDGGNIVVSIMDAETRNFYSLEELWYEARIVRRSIT